MLDIPIPPLLAAPPASPTHAEAQGPCFLIVSERFLKVFSTLIMRLGSKIFPTRRVSLPEKEKLT